MLGWNSDTTAKCDPTGENAVAWLAADAARIEVDGAPQWEVEVVTVAFHSSGKVAAE
jgi:hypothetical protein